MSVVSGVASQVQIFKRAGGYKVRPATLGAGRGTDVVFFNATAVTVKLLFPVQIFEGVTSGSVSIAAGDSERLTLLEHIALGTYPYAVFWEESGLRDFASGESAPIIIIDR